MSDGFKVLEALLYLTNARHGVIASNIANVDTPFYRAKDIKFKMHLDEEVIALKVTNAKHISDAASTVSKESRVEENQPWLDENNVELDMEVAKMTENGLLYQAGANMLSSKIKMFKSALRR